ncbi:DUF2378 family protein [Vitiosangium sp. GDMCC 1.1324]|uniref:DUF2378 family protein n=1 Tax=Vitiosangium sp. (strain GDMCC 1.1324) TaxID=2138576 RepID=UPI000D332230|nr:DUF2378 family protein [Vitiosangium sp. GDMCC 1.1324]PTL75817.1 TIGR02265 family protein [Vitiosangium sp. GDMCC 1.1324]
MSETPLIFNHTLQGLFARTFPQGVPAELKAKLRTVGVELDKPLLPAYPVQTWARCVEFSAPVAFPRDRREVAWRKLGERMIDGYQDSMIGGAMFSMLRLLGPRRMLLRAQKNFRTGNNYTEVRTADVSPTAMDLWFNETEDALRHFTAGLVLAGMRVGGAEEPQVDILQVDPKGVTLRATWKQKA